jgi:hypothetical protein
MRLEYGFREPAFKVFVAAPRETRKGGYCLRDSGLACEFSSRPESVRKGRRGAGVN